MKISNIFVNRTIQSYLEWLLSEQKSILLLGPRQVGKTTLLKSMKCDLFLSINQPAIRIRYEKDPNILYLELKALIDETDHIPLVILDEIQKVPSLLDVIQDFIDEKLVQFILSGSSARQLKHGEKINLLPGRLIRLQLDPLNIDELSESKQSLEQLLNYGSLPEVILTENQRLKEALLSSYVTIYLEEEIRAEAVVRDLGTFARFLELAAGESGKIVNFTKLSQEIGVSSYTIQSYFEILEDCLIAERIEPYTQTNNPRRRLTKSQKFLMYDLGVRRLAAKEGTQLPRKYLGHLFEQFIGIELIRMSRTREEQISLFYWRDQSGPEVDWVLKVNRELIPIEVKLTDTPSIDDAKHLTTFLNEYEMANKAYVVCQTPRPLQLSDNIKAISWKNLHKIIS